MPRTTTKPDFKELRRLLKDRPLFLAWLDDYEELWNKENPSSEETKNGSM